MAETTIEAGRRARQAARPRRQARQCGVLLLAASAPTAVLLDHAERQGQSSPRSTTPGSAIAYSRLLGAQGELWPNWRYHCFVTDRHDLDTKAADANHRGHATVELAIRDLKESSGLSRCPSGQFPANGAWLACCVLAHNLARWTARLGRTHPARQLTVLEAATIRNRLLTVPGRLVNHSGRHRLRLPLNWPWQNTFTTALQRIRNLPQLI